ncbi:MAG: hypothetical protein CMH78_00045, partial [Nitrospinae bacterium]|nr:hypothetical protein [Nitrospinota bacterium]
TNSTSGTNSGARHYFYCKIDLPNAGWGEIFETSLPFVGFSMIIGIFLYLFIRIGIEFAFSLF